jgi:hypothetical protein
MAFFLSSASDPCVCFGTVGRFGFKKLTLPVAERHTHLYCIGTTGQGKSKFLENLFVQDILAGRGCGLIDPHTDLARDTLSHLSSAGYFRDPQSYERLIYFDPTRSDYVLPFNILKSPFHPYIVAQQVIEAFRRTWPQALEEAPRFSNIALAALLVLIETGQTLVEMPTLLTNKTYREHLLKQVQNEDVVDYFHSRFDKWDRDGPTMAESVLNKVTAFTFNPYLKHILGATENRLDFKEIMNQGKVLIVDLGRCDPETRRLVGSLVTTGMEMAAMSRIDQDGERKPFYMFIDEFQDFSANEGAAKTLAQILSECRKFGLYLHLAHQTLGQLHGRISSALGNVGIRVVFSIDREDAVVMAPKLFSVDTEAVKHDAQTESQHPMYSPLQEQWENATASIQRLRPRHALIKRRNAPIVQMRTARIPPYRATNQQVDALQRYLAQTQGVPLASSEPARPPAPAPVTLVDWEPTTNILI